VFVASQDVDLLAFVICSVHVIEVINKYIHSLLDIILIGLRFDEGDKHYLLIFLVSFKAITFLDVEFDIGKLIFQIQYNNCLRDVLINSNKVLIWNQGRNVYSDIIALNLRE
jgi:hypothetical protein